MGPFRRTRRRGREDDDVTGKTPHGAPATHTEFAAVYDRFADAILRYCQVRIDDPTDAEDAAALIFTNAFAAFPPRDYDSLRSWLFAIAHNVIANHYRTRQARSPSRPLGVVVAVAVVLTTREGSPPAAALTDRVVAIDAVPAGRCVHGAAGLARIRRGHGWIGIDRRSRRPGRAPARLGVGRGDRPHPLEGQPGSLVVADGVVWATSSDGAAVRIDPASGRITQTVPTGSTNPAATAARPGEVWLADATNRSLIVLDARTGAVKATHALDLRPTAIAAVDDTVWVAAHDEGLIAQVDATSGRTLQTIRVGNGPAALAVAGGALWVANTSTRRSRASIPDRRRRRARSPSGAAPRRSRRRAHRCGSRASTRGPSRGSTSPRTA